MISDINKEVLDSLMGRSIDDWTEGDDGIHFHMNDGRTAIISGVFWIAVMEADEKVMH